jgi:DNA-binding Lrp family transcriptional regulator
LLQVLRDDARLSVTELAKRVNISRANAYARLDRLTTSGVIEGFEVRVDPRAVGLDLTALIFVTVDQSRWREIRDFLAAIPEVEFIGLAAGDFDFVLLVRTTSTDTLRDVVLERFHAIPEVRDTRTVMLLDSVARAPHIP